MKEKKNISNKNINNNKYKKNNDYRNQILNDYYNKEIRQKNIYTRSDEDSEEKKENKIKYLDWTENNTIQQNTNSDQINSNKNTNSNYENNITNNTNRKNKNNYKRDKIINQKGNTNNKNSKNLASNKNKNYNKIYDKNNFLDVVNNNLNNQNMNDIIEKEDDINEFKINFFNSNDKDKSLSEISSNRRGEIEDSLLSQNSINKDQYKEILFQIKLTKEEYRLLLREKAKIINPFKE